jgi:diacylglycerol kinase family enzyme
VELVVDGHAERLRAVGVLVGNVGQLIAGVPLLPEARADDGLLHVAVLTPRRARDWAGLVLRVLGRRAPHPCQMRNFTAEELQLTWPAEVPVEVDGDLSEPRRQLQFRVRPSALSVCVPGSGAAA